MRCCWPVPGLLVELRQLERDHGVAGALVELSKLSGRVAAVFGFADAGLNLSPIGHMRGIVAANSANAITIGCGRARAGLPLEFEVRPWRSTSSRAKF